MSHRVLIMARAPLPGKCKRLLEPRLGSDGCARLQAALISRAARWASSVAPGAVDLACVPADGCEAVAPLVPDGVDVLPAPEGPLAARFAGLVSRVMAGHGGSLIVAGVDLPALGPGHAAAVLDDLASGCDVSFGPATDGGCYVLGLRRPDPGLLGRAIGAWRRTEITMRALTAASDRDMSVALLRSERELHGPADLRALVADPLAPADILGALERGATLQGRWGVV